MKGQREYIIFGTGLIIGLIIGYGLFSGGVSNTTAGNNATTTDSTTGSIMATSTAMTGGDAVVSNVTVSDQVAGESVEVGSFAASFDAWVAIREVNAQSPGVPGAILGAKLFPTGTASGTIALLRNSVPNETYYVSVYQDNGDRSFDFKANDPVVKDAEGNEYLATFKTYPATPH